MNTSPPPESSSRSAAAPTRTTPGTIVIGSTCWAVMTPMIADPQTPRPSCVYYCTLRTLAPAIQHTKVHVKALDARLGALPCQESWAPGVRASPGPLTPPDRHRHDPGHVVQNTHPPATAHRHDPARRTAHQLPRHRDRHGHGGRPALDVLDVDTVQAEQQVAAGTRISGRRTGARRSVGHRRGPRDSRELGRLRSSGTSTPSAPHPAHRRAATPTGSPMSLLATPHDVAARPAVDAVLPRRSAVLRAQVDGSSHGQLLAANADVAAVVEGMFPDPDPA